MKLSNWGGRAAAFALALGIAAANWFGWEAVYRPVPAPDFNGPISGLAYNAFQRWDSPIERKYPTMEQINADMLQLSQLTRRIRTYSSSEFIDLPAIAAQHGLRVTQGVWLDEREANNRREMEAVKIAVRHNANIERVIAGNETILHAQLTPEQLIGYLRELRKSIRVPVSTAEPWHVWLRYPELAKNVDYITVHLLPYWEGVRAEDSYDYAMKRLEQVRAAFPNKHIVIGEIGWPSQGERFVNSEGGIATASPELQAQFLRDFLARTKGKHLDYFIMEAIDQPWKMSNEGRVGAYWGMFHSDRTPKFAFEGPVEKDPNWRAKALAASVIGFLAAAWFLLAFRRLRVASRITFGVFIQATASFVVWLVMVPFDYYLRPGDWVSLAVLVPTLAMMIAIVLAHGFEFVEMFWRGNLKREFAPKPLAEGERQPMVSVHLACCNEQPEMVIATVESLRNLDYDNYEVLVIDNNTRDEALWRPVEEYMSKLGPRFKFFHLPSWPGFKAGALNFALTQTDPAAEVVGVVDADYVVKPDWLRATVGYFADRKVAVVQCPQAHRGWARQAFRRMMNFEYDGFFRIGMHHRNERDAIIQHGTMTLMRADALNDMGRWSEWCICEDAELGLRLMKAGMSTVYIDRVMGEGLTPDDFGAFKKQRRRWAFGAMQIVKHHGRALLRPGELTGAQRYHFVSGWLSWFGDALHLCFAMAAIAWSIGIVGAPKLFHYPIMLFLLPLIAFFAVKALFGPLLYWRRVRCSAPDVAGAAIAGMALSHAIALGVFSGLWHRTGVFEITKKGAKINQGGGFAAVREEALLMSALVLAMVAVGITRKPGHLESALWMAVLALQAIPYAAAVFCAAVSRLPERALPEAAVERPLPAPQPAGTPAAPATLAPVRGRTGLSGAGGLASAAGLGMKSEMSSEHRL